MTFRPFRPNPSGLLVFSVFVVASCGLAYELVSAALASYLLGDSILQFSSIIGTYLFAMGVGSHLSRYVKDEGLIARFIDIELMIGLLGGLSASALFVLFAFDATPFRSTLYALVFGIGALVGMEIPLVMRLLNQQNIRFGDLVSQVLTFDYLGALAVSLLFPLVLAPRLGLARTALLFGMTNTAIALLTLHTFRAQLVSLTGRMMRATVVLSTLALGFLFSPQLTAWTEKSVFGDDILHALTSPYQRIVVTRWKDDLRLFLNGNLQFSSRDEHRYHEALVRPALEALPSAQRVLIIGGGDGLAAREVLKYSNITQIILVDLDSQMTQLFATAPELVKLNQGSLTHPRLKLINTDAAKWLEENQDFFDIAIVDLPDPANFSLGKLYSTPFYRLLEKHVNAHGYIVVQSTSPWFAPHAFWTVESTLREAGLRTWPYHAYVPSFGEWGFILASRSADFIPPTQFRVPTQFLDEYSTARMFHFPPDMSRLEMLPNQLNRQPLVDVFERDWHNTIR